MHVEQVCGRIERLSRQLRTKLPTSQMEKEGPIKRAESSFSHQQLQVGMAGGVLKTCISCTRVHLLRAISVVLSKWLDRLFNEALLFLISNIQLGGSEQMPVHVDPWSGEIAAFSEKL